jgi:mono/diheme cytochrome c family protein
MKRFLRVLGSALLVLTLVIVGLVLYINYRSEPTYEVNIPTIKVNATSEAKIRGKKLVLSLCAECHRNPETKELTGRRLMDLPEQFGVAYSKNITRHPVEGIGSWSAGEIAWLIRTGIHPKRKTYVPAWMVKLPHISDSDMNAIIAFLQSDDPLVAPSEVKNIESNASFFAKLLTFVGAFKHFDYPTEAKSHPDTTNTVEYGRYMADNVMNCFACHSSDFATNNDFEPRKSEGYCGGGNMMPDFNGVLVPTSNITPDKTTGIGSWTRQEFVTTLSTGFKKDGSILRYPMGRYAHLSETELGCIYDYLRTIPAISKQVPKPPQPQMSANPTEGEKHYYSYGCVHCHGSTGLGYANLQLADKRYPSDSILTDVILHTYKYFPETSMPKWDGKINPNHLPAIIAHVRELGKKSGK